MNHLRRLFIIAYGDEAAMPESREDFVPNPRYKPILHFRDEDEFFLFVSSHEQCIKPVGIGDVTANDEILTAVRAVLDPRA